jgi:hypothetical protein
MRHRRRTYADPAEVVRAAARAAQQAIAGIYGARAHNLDLAASEPPPPGQEDERPDYFSVEWSRSGSADCTLYFSSAWAGTETEEASEAGPARKIRRVRFDVKVSCPGTGRPPAEAVAVAALQLRVAELACHLESIVAHAGDAAWVTEKPAESK